ncbi:MAG: hypothetical protein ACTSP5_11610 [Candidatus Heimdallarchaeota archaeon]
MAVHDAKNSVNVTKIESPENKVTLKEAIIANLIIGPIALGLYFGIYYGIHIANPIYILNNMYYFPYLLSFCCFFVLPVLYLIIFRIITKKKTRLFISTKKGLEPKNIISGLNISNRESRYFEFFPPDTKPRRLFLYDCLYCVKCNKDRILHKSICPNTIL